jgi:hypothetical protein
MPIIPLPASKPMYSGKYLPRRSITVNVERILIKAGRL